MFEFCLNLHFVFRFKGAAMVSTGIHILSRTIFIALLNRDSISLYNTAKNEMSLVLKFLSNRAIT